MYEDHVIGRIGEPADLSVTAQWGGVWKKMKGNLRGVRKSVVTPADGTWIERSRTEAKPGLVLTLYLWRNVSVCAAGQGPAHGTGR